MYLGLRWVLRVGAICEGIVALGPYRRFIAPPGFWVGLFLWVFAYGLERGGRFESAWCEAVGSAQPAYVDSYP